MAVIQVSLIQVRSGLNEDLPALATGEFGWSIDTRQLYIGNGTTAEGAPTPGVTEILTEYSNGLLSMSITNLEANVANLQSNVTTLQSQITSIVPNVIVLSDNTTLGNTGITFNNLSTERIYYNIIRGTTARVGVLKATNYFGNVVYDDEYDESASTGVTLSFANFGNTAELVYTTTSTGNTATLTYTIASA
jgi:hypothetical protein